ncbi:Major intrinsic protein [Dillenia turbinata]|uniref:Major intrinsic protein n=1 Tax=Dillenia turbinata TaxID=194707 RepID=A0AAN8W545_9MAGN
MGAIKLVIADAILTGMWVFCASCLGIGTRVISTALGIQDQAHASIFITTVLVYILVFIFGIIGDLLGGATGAVGGALAIVEVMPIQYKHMLGGPSVKVDLHTGAMAEGILTLIISLAVLLIIIRGPRSPLLKNWLLAMSTVALVVAGSSYTGPSMNPANAFGWAYVNNKHDKWEHFYVYWVCPFIGATIAAWIFRALFAPAPAPKKQKKA